MNKKKSVFLVLCQIYKHRKRPLYFFLGHKNRAELAFLRATREAVDALYVRWLRTLHSYVSAHLDRASWARII